MSTPAGFDIELPDRNEIVVVVPGPQGPKGDAGETPERNVFVQTVDPNLTEPGIWIETGLGADGTGFTLWIEDGV